MKGIKQVRAAILAAAIAGFGWSAPKALADSVSIDISFQSSDYPTDPGVSGTIVLQAEPTAVLGQYLATGGSGTVTDTQGGYTGNFTLDVGALGSDDLIVPGIVPVADSSGLAFATGSTGDLQLNSPGGSLEWDTTNDSVAIEDSSAPVPAPLPASAGVGFGMLGAVGGLALLRKRLSRKSRFA